MKAKEFLNKVMRGDKTTIKNNVGLIGFDKKLNHIEHKGSEEGLYASIFRDDDLMLFLLITKEKVDTSDITVSANGVYLENIIDAENSIISEYIIEELRLYGFNVTSSAVGLYAMLGIGSITKYSQYLQGTLPLILTADGKTWQSTYTNKPIGFIMQDPNDQNKGVILWNKSDNVGWTDPQNGQFRISTDITDKVTFDSYIFTPVSSESPEFIREFDGYGYYPINFAISEEGEYTILYDYGDWVGEGDISIVEDINS